MKHLLLLALMITMGCSETAYDKARAENQKYTETNYGDHTLNGFSVRVEIFDSCEYIVVGWIDANSITHKGNCKFCTKRNIEAKEVK